MAVEKGINPFSFPASADLSALQYRMVNLASDGEVQATTGDGVSIGVLQNDPAALGRAASVQTLAGTVSKLEVSTTGSTASIAVMDTLAPSTADDGIGVISASTVAIYRLGRALEAVSTGVSGRIISFLITHEGVD